MINLKTLFKIGFVPLSIAPFVRYAKGFYYLYHTIEIIIESIKNILVQHTNIAMGAIIAAPLLAYFVNWHSLLKYFKATESQAPVENSAVSAGIKLTKKDIIYYNYLKKGFSRKEISQMEKVKQITVNRHIKRVKTHITNGTLEHIL